MKEKSLLLQLQGDNPILRIIDFMLENKGFDVTKNDIINGADISRAALFKYWKEIERFDIVKVTRRFGKTKLYTLNSENPIIKRLMDLELELIKNAMDKEHNKIHRLKQLSY